MENQGQRNFIIDTVHALGQILSGHILICTAGGIFQCTLLLLPALSSSTLMVVRYMSYFHPCDGSISCLTVPPWNDVSCVNEIFFWVAIRSIQFGVWYVECFQCSVETLSLFRRAKENSFFYVFCAMFSVWWVLTFQ